VKRLITGLFLLFFLAACAEVAGELIDVGLFEDVYEDAYIEEVNYFYDDNYINDEINEVSDFVPQIVVISFSQFDVHNVNRGSNWQYELIYRYGIENLNFYSWPSSRSSNLEFYIEELVSTIVENPDIKVLLVDDLVDISPQIVDEIKSHRQDIFIISICSRSSLANADLTVTFDSGMFYDTFPAVALDFGATTLVYFYDSMVWGEYEVYEESVIHTNMRNKSLEIGLNFVEVDIYGAIQCGSSHAMFLAEVLPPLLESYGPDVVFFGLDNERMFWHFIVEQSFIYLPMYSSWFDANPINIAHELSWGQDTQIHGIYDIPYLIDYIKNAFGEYVKRLAIYPVSYDFLIPVAVVEYGLTRSGGGNLQEIIESLIFEFSGVNHDIVLSFDDSGSGNQVLFFMDYMMLN